MGAIAELQCRRRWKKETGSEPTTKPSIITSLLQIIVGVVCLCVVATSHVAFAQNYYEEYQTGPQQQQQQQPQQHRPAPARLSPSNGPVETKPMPVAILKQINRQASLLLIGVLDTLIGINVGTRGDKTAKQAIKPASTHLYVTTTHEPRRDREQRRINIVVVTQFSMRRLHGYNNNIIKCLHKQTTIFWYEAPSPQTDDSKLLLMMTMEINIAICFTIASRVSFSTSSSSSFAGSIVSHGIQLYIYVYIYLVIIFPSSPNFIGY